MRQWEGFGSCDLVGDYSSSLWNNLSRKQSRRLGNVQCCLAKYTGKFVIRFKNLEMRAENLEKKKLITLHPGDHYATNQDVILSTLLGSCVSACLYDPENKVIGMNHFLLSSEGYHSKAPLSISNAGRYGVHAMELVINGMLKLGAKRKYLKAKVFGGGNILNSGIEECKYSTVGNENVRFIREFLDTEKIPLISFDLGGGFGRIIRFYAGDYAVYVKKIKNTTSSDLAKRDREYLKKSLENQTSGNNDIELW